MTRKLIAVAVAVAAMSMLQTPSPAIAEDLDEESELLDRGLLVQSGQAELSEPRRHERERQPSLLSAEEAQRIYESLMPERSVVLSVAGNVGASGFIEWRRYNNAPYLSQAHGNTYVNNYVNAAGRAYGRYEEAGTLPVGTVIAKDSFVVHSDGSYELGQLVVMEKMPAGFNRVSGDWRYSAISPTGEILGTTRGANADQVAYCVPCHLARERTDHLFFLPEAFRMATE